MTPLTLDEAKNELLTASSARDAALEIWPGLPSAIAISGLLDCYEYAREWNKHNQKINELLTLYPELNT